MATSRSPIPHTFLTVQLWYSSGQKVGVYVSPLGPQWVCGCGERDTTLLLRVGHESWEGIHGVLVGIPPLGTQSPCCKEAWAAPWRSPMEMFWLRYPLTGNINWQTCEWVSLQLLLSCRPEIWRPQSLWTETSHLHCAFSECLTHRILELNKMVVVLLAGFWAYSVGHRSNWNGSPHWEGNIPKGGKGALKYLVEDYSS